MSTNNFPLYKVMITLGSYTVYDKKLQLMIYFAYDFKMNQKCCVKIIDIKDKTLLQQLEMQLKNNYPIYPQNNENLIKIHKIVIESQKLYIFQEICDSDLVHAMKHDISFDQQKILDFMCQISKGYLGLRQFVKDRIYRDLKPENILVNLDLKQNRAIYKICDYGLTLSNRFQPSCGPLYAAPEIRNSQYSFEAHAFSFGLIVLEILMQEEITYDFKKQLIEFLKQKQRLKQWLNLGQEQEQLKNNYPKLNALDKLKQIDEDLLNILNDLLLINPEERMDWQGLNIQVQKLCTKISTEQKNNQNQSKLPTVCFNNQNFNQTSNINNRMYQSSVVEINNKQQVFFQNPSNFNQNQQIQINQNQSTINLTKVNQVSNQQPTFRKK